MERDAVEIVQGIFVIPITERSESLPGGHFWAGSFEVDLFPGEVNPVTDLGKVAVFCKIRKATPSRRSFIQCVISSPHELVTALIVIGCYTVLQPGADAERVIAHMKEVSEPLFRDEDARGYDCYFQPLTTSFIYWYDYVRGFAYAVKKKFFNLDEFNIKEYRSLSVSTTHDASVIIPKKLVALADPLEPKNGERFISFTHEETLSELVNMGVERIIKLNKENYNKFEGTLENYQEKLGLEIDIDMTFEDMGLPTKEIVNLFYNVMKKSRTYNVAVHCKQGLGRTGILICTYLIRKYHFTGREALGYLRLVRPFSVFGNQQNYVLWFSHQKYPLEKEYGDLEAEILETVIDKRPDVLSNLLRDYTRTGKKLYFKGKGINIMEETEKYPEMRKIILESSILDERDRIK